MVILSEKFNEISSVYYQMTLTLHIRVHNHQVTMAARIADILMRITHLEGLLMMLVNNVPVSLHIIVTVICLPLCLQILVVI